MAESDKIGQLPGTLPPTRTDFQRDRARVLHSFALRRLAATTQVKTAGEEDFPRTRLTHSLEVAQIGREMGEALGCDPDLVDAACLAHDLGHPPFGHNGEAALDAVAKPCGGFEGNAQALRTLTRLEAKTLTAQGVSVGLNLTRAVLDATIKYPWERNADNVKFGVYEDDREAFAWIRHGAPDRRRCLEAQVMDWADDVAYSVHDVEDGIHSGHIRLSHIAAQDERAAVCELTAQIYSPLSETDLDAVLRQLLVFPMLRDVERYDGSFRAQVALKRATSELTARFLTSAITATRAVSGQGALLRYEADLVVPDQIAAECALLKGIAMRYVMRRSAVASLQQRQREVLEQLVYLLASQAPQALDPAFRPRWSSADSDAQRLRVIIDQVAQLTDRSAISWHSRLAA